ncbi:MAG: hypothetical protein Q7S73_01245 [bacterium]|nr:hypothetical protein [bacterium]
MEANNVSIVYLLAHLGRRILDFLRHWYIHGFLRAIDVSYNILEKLDKIFALQITAKNWFQPLYQDYSIIGYLWGFVFRTARIFASLVIYGIFIILSSILFILWALLPPYVIYKIISSL